ncbi:T6SS effector phospholipase Tle3 domain-containing protein [Paraburkholderia megapolitana]|uniref:T6SS effector phospholipase Tle3 domain-containing protein n=1 Tax=Paraburkholderia megapolitana TaxID=420953 RepID=UPI0038B84B2B
MSDTDSGRKPIAHHTGTTVPNRDSQAHRQVPLPQRFPCTTILIHGVNDLGTDFETVEGGLCEGLNDRLGRSDLKGGTYTHGRMANDPKNVTTTDLMKNLDDVIYRRQEPKGTRSPLIPFYWGFRANKDDLPIDSSKQTVNGQYVDKFGNRLDAHRAKNGGMFANATTNIPDMFNTHFKGGAKTSILNAAQGDPTHPLREAPDRHYMVLAAKRLAALVRQIRLIDPDGTVNIIAHSQGTIISLLAQAFLVDGISGKCGPADRPADTLILIDSPYSFAESSMDQHLQTSDEQQTIWARVKTLANLTGLVAANKHSAPPPEKLQVVKGQDNHGVAGPKWGPQQATRLTGPQGNTSVVFTERDNRGKVYVYFCPEDATVGLRGVNGMGSIGLPDAINTGQAGTKPENVGLVSDTFRQRIFTRRKRGDKPVQVGTPPGPYNLRESGESSHGAKDWLLTATHLKQAPIAANTTRNINGEQLTPPFDPDLEQNRLPGTGDKPLGWLYPNEFEAGKQSIDQVEAETALSVSDLQQLNPQVMSWPDYHVQYNAPPGGQAVPRADEVASVLNQGKDDPDDQCKVLMVESLMPPTNGKILVTRQETPNEAKVRLMNDLRADDSYHSAVMSGRLNHRGATAFDVSIGQARTLDDPEWAKLLRAIADWRIALGDIKKTNPRYNQLDKTTVDIVQANYAYYKDGTFPPDAIVPKTPPPPVVSEIMKTKNEVIKARQKQIEEQLRSNPINNIPFM